MKKTSFVILSIFLICLLNADHVDRTRVDTLQTINSFSSLGNFHTIEYVGDYEYILDFLDNIYVGSSNPGFENFGCSLFSGLGDDDNIFFGRNFDNPQQDVLVGKYVAPDCYESIAINRLADMGLILGTDFENLTTQQELLLLRAPYFAADGINEMGVAAGLAYVDSVPVEIDPEKENIFITRWVREILDHAANVEEAVEISNSYNIIDNMFGQNELCHHLLISDRNGSSVILEYHDGAFEAIEPEVDWQVLTNTHIYNHTLQQMFNLCYRYELLYDALEEQNGVIYDWENAMEILELPTWGNLSNGTQWSSLFDLNENLLYLSLYRDFDNIARVDLDTFEFLNFGDFHLEDLVIQDMDGDGEIEPGEQVYIISAVSVDFNSSDVTGVLSSEDNDIIYFNSVSEYGDIQPGDIVHNAMMPFHIQIPSDATGEIDFTITLTTSYEYSFEILFSMPIAETGSEDGLLPAHNVLLQNHPNPFNPTTVISFQHSGIRDQEDADLTIYNIKGQTIRTYPVILSGVEGRIDVTWDGTDSNNQEVPSGIYFYKLKAGEFEQTKKMLLLK
jgi:linear amide C-N hydrolase (choloylglycine hydrolase family)/flagellar hook capping protein FlgD